MGREIRRVPPNWEHPKNEKGEYIPIFDRLFKDAANEWVEEFLLWQKGEHPDQKDNETKEKYPYYWQWNGLPPNEKYYLSETLTVHDKTWFQVYETVSEGTPVTPPFPTKEDLVDYLVKHGDFWDQHLCDGGWDRKIAQDFVEKEWAPSMVFTGNKLLMPRNGA